MSGDKIKIFVAERTQYPLVVNSTTSLEPSSRTTDAVACSRDEDSIEKLLIPKACSLSARYSSVWQKDADGDEETVMVSFAFRSNQDPNFLGAWTEAQQRLYRSASVIMIDKFEFELGSNVTLRHCSLPGCMRTDCQRSEKSSLDAMAHDRGYKVVALFKT